MDSMITEHVSGTENGAKRAENRVSGCGAGARLEILR